MLKSPVGIKKFAKSAKFDPPQTLHGLTRVFTNYICLLEVLFGDQCHHLHLVLRLRDGLDLHKRSLESRVTLFLMINLLWQVHQDFRQFFDACEKWDDGKPLPCSMLPTMVSALVNDVHITLYLTCLVMEFLGTPALATAAGKKQDGAPLLLGGAGNPLRICSYLSSVPQWSETPTGYTRKWTSWNFQGRQISNTIALWLEKKGSALILASWVDAWRHVHTNI